MEPKTEESAARARSLLTRGNYQTMFAMVPQGKGDYLRLVSIEGEMAEEGCSSKDVTGASVASSQNEREFPRAAIGHSPDMTRGTATFTCGYQQFSGRGGGAFSCRNSRTSEPISGYHVLMLAVEGDRWKLCGRSRRDVAAHCRSRIPLFQQGSERNPIADFVRTIARGHPPLPPAGICKKSELANA